MVHHGHDLRGRCRKSKRFQGENRGNAFRPLVTVKRNVWAYISQGEDFQARRNI